MATQAGIGRDDAIPLYHQIFLGLRDEILSGRRPFGAAVPTEHELIAHYGVSRITARRALDELAAHALVERRRRVGTRVIFKAPATPIEANIDQAIESLIAFGRDTQVRVISLDEQPADVAVAAQLGLAEGATTVRALRIRYLNQTPLGAVESYVPAHFAGALTRERLTAAPLLEIVRAAGHTIGGGTQTISAIAADPSLAALLETDPRAPIIQIERVVHNRGGTPLLFTIARYRGDRYRLVLDLQGGPHSATGV
jgi:GntR family transcriptional regulator